MTILAAIFAAIAIFLFYIRQEFINDTKTALGKIQEDMDILKTKVFTELRSPEGKPVIPTAEQVDDICGYILDARDSIKEQSKKVIN